MRPGRHGGMSSGELEQIIARNGCFLSVRRAGDGDGYAGLYNSVTGEFILGINGGWLPEYSRMRKLNYKCPCTPRGTCRTGQHGTDLLRGWRNVLYELVSRGRVSATREIQRVLGQREALDARDYGMQHAPMFDTSPAWDYRGLRAS